MANTYLVNYWKGNESVVALKESSMAPDTCGFSLQSLSPLIKKKKKKSIRDNEMACQMPQEQLMAKIKQEPGY